MSLPNNFHLPSFAELRSPARQVLAAALQTPQIDALLLDLTLGITGLRQIRSKFHRIKQ